MTIAEKRLIEAIRKIVKNYDDNEESMYQEIDDARKLVDMLDPQT